MTGRFEADLLRAASLLKNARHAVAFTGAGVSTPSGIPDFRSPVEGLWQRYDPMEVASLGVFQSRPEKFFDWLRPLLRTIWAASPNPAHLALAQMEAAGILKATITQNIDDLHQRAGTKQIYEVHGSLRSMSCSRCGETYPSEQFRAALERDGGIPHCPQCGRVMKPDIILFGEMLPEDVWQEAEAHCAQADVVLVVGSSLEVWPAASLPEHAILNGARLIICNLTPTHLQTRADVFFPADVAEILPQLAHLVT